MMYVSKLRGVDRMGSHAADKELQGAARGPRAAVDHHASARVSASKSHGSRHRVKNVGFAVAKCWKCGC